MFEENLDCLPGAGAADSTVMERVRHHEAFEEPDIEEMNRMASTRNRTTWMSQHTHFESAHILNERREKEHRDLLDPELRRAA